MEARGDIVPYDEPPTDPRGVVKNDVEFAVSSSLSEYRLQIKPIAFNANFGFLLIFTIWFLLWFTLNPSMAFQIVSFLFFPLFLMCVDYFVDLLFAQVKTKIFEFIIYLIKNVEQLRRPYEWLSACSDDSFDKERVTHVDNVTSSILVFKSKKSYL